MRRWCLLCLCLLHKGRHEGEMPALEQVGAQPVGCRLQRGPGLREQLRHLRGMRSHCRYKAQRMGRIALPGQRLQRFGHRTTGRRPGGSRHGPSRSARCRADWVLAGGWPSSSQASARAKKPCKRSSVGNRSTAISLPWPAAGSGMAFSDTPAARAQDASWGRSRAGTSWEKPERASPPSNADPLCQSARKALSSKACASCSWACAWAMARSHREAMKAAEPSRSAAVHCCNERSRTRGKLAAVCSTPQSCRKRSNCRSPGMQESTGWTPPGCATCPAKPGEVRRSAANRSLSRQQRGRRCPDFPSGHRLPPV